MSLIAGLPLKPLADNCLVYFEKERERNPQGAINISSLRQAVLNLSAMSGNPLSFEGEAIADVEAHKASMTAEADMCLFLYLEMFVYAIFGDYEKGASMALEHEGRFQKAAAGLFMTMHETYARGLNLFGMARNTKLPKYKRAAKRVLSQVNEWAKHDNPNVMQYSKLFQAELFALNGKINAAELAYHQALGFANRLGCIHDEAIIHERFADFFWNSKQSLEEAEFHIEKSCEKYYDWGCPLKAEILQKFKGIF